MSEAIRIPVLAENISAVEIVRVLVAAGDSVKKDQSLIEIEASKAVVEIPSTIAGTVDAILVKPGDTVAVGEPFIRIVAGANPSPELPKNKPAAETAKTAKPAPAPTAHATEKPKSQPTAKPPRTAAPAEPETSTVTVTGSTPAPAPITTEAPPPPPRAGRAARAPVCA